jgi:hypothetical protein
MADPVNQIDRESVNYLLNELQFDVLDKGSQTSIKLISSFAKYLKSAAICNHLD